jgi:hypothetical protein
MPILGKKAYFWSTHNMGRKRNMQKRTEKKHTEEEGKTTCGRKKSSVARMLENIAILGLGFWA